MKIMFSFMAELLRVILLFLLGMYLLWQGEMHLYGEEIALKNSFLLAVVNFLIVFLVYRNHLQFTGWFKSEKAKKLPPVFVKMVWFIILVVLILIIPIIEMANPMAS